MHGERHFVAKCQNRKLRNCRDDLLCGGVSPRYDRDCPHAVITPGFVDGVTITNVEYRMPLPPECGAVRIFGYDAAVISRRMKPSASIGLPGKLFICAIIKA